MKLREAFNIDAQGWEVIVGPKETDSALGTREEDTTSEGRGHWWADRLVVLRPEASDSDWSLMHVVPASKEEVANRALETVLNELRK